MIAHTGKFVFVVAADVLPDAVVQAGQHGPAHCRDASPGSRSRF